MGRCRLGGRGVSIRYPNIKSTYASFAVLRQALTGGINAPLKRSHLSSFIRISLHLLHTVLDIYCCLYCLMGGIASVFAIWAFWPLRKKLHSRKQWKGRDGHSYGRTQQDWQRGRDGVFVSLLVKVHIEKGKIPRNTQASRPQDYHIFGFSASGIFILYEVELGLELVPYIGRHIALRFGQIFDVCVPCLCI